MCLVLSQFPNLKQLDVDLKLIFIVKYYNSVIAFSIWSHCLLIAKKIKCNNNTKYIKNSLFHFRNNLNEMQICHFETASFD